MTAHGGTSGINVEPTVYLDQKAGYINHLNELRRLNEGDDTADSPGYALNLIRIPVSILPGKRTEIGHGAEVTMTLTPHLNEELLPTTFRNLILNDLVDQIAYPITQFINNPDNSIYLDESKSSELLYGDVAQLFSFLDEKLDLILPNIEEGDLTTLSKLLNMQMIAERDDTSRAELKNILTKLPTMIRDSQDATKELQNLRLRLTLQPLFLQPEWKWIDEILTKAQESQDELQRYQNELQLLTKKPEAMPAPRKMPPERSADQGQPHIGKTVKNRDTSQIATSYAHRLRELRTMQSSRKRFENLPKQKIGLQAAVIIPATKSRRARLPFPPSQMVEIYSYELTYELALDAYRGLFKEPFAHPCPDSQQVYIHMPDVQGYLQEELAAAYKLLSNPNNCDLWHEFCTEELANAVLARQTERIKAIRNDFRNAMKCKAAIGAPAGKNATVRDATVALAWATIVESALLTQQLVQDMKESAAAKGCPKPPEGWQPYFLPDPPPETRQAFNEYVRCRWPIHVFALDPTTQQQNISDTFSGRREMQLAMSLAFVSGKISASNMMRYARRIEFDFATIDLNGTSVGFSHGDDTFGWRFYPRFQTPDIESNATVLFRDLLWGGPSKNALLRQRRLEPGIRECVAIVIMPSFVPYADLNVSSNWFALTNPKRKLMDTEFAMRMSKSVKTIEKCGPNVQDSDCYRDGDLNRLLFKAKQLSERLPFQSTAVQIPYENTLGGFAMFNTGVTDLAPELTGWYGSPSINPNQPTTVFLVGNHFSVHQTRVIAGGNEVPQADRELLSRQVVKVVIPPNPVLGGEAGQQFVDVQIATPYGVTQHLPIPVCNSALTAAGKATAPAGKAQAPTGNLQPASGTAQAPAGNAQAPAVNTQAPASNGQSPTGNSQPSTGNTQAPSGNAQPSTGNAQPSTGTSQSPSGNSKAPAGNAKPTTGKTKSPSPGS